MKKFTISICVTSLFIACLILAACSKEEASEPLNIGAHPDLAAHSAEFEKEVIEVAQGIYVAIGYGLANCILLEGDDGVLDCALVVADLNFLVVWWMWSELVESGRLPRRLGCLVG